jgi:hypothetical protein
MWFKEPRGETPKPPVKTPRQVNGAKGGVKDGAARASKLTPEQRSGIAKKAVQDRWTKA